MANASKIRALEAKLAIISKQYADVSWQLTLARAGVEPDEYDATAKAIIRAGNKRRGEDG